MSEPIDAGTLAIRARFQAELGPELQRLTTLRPLRRVADLATWLGLWVVSAYVAAWGIAATGMLGMAAVGTGVLGCAVAINALNLLMHEGMHGILFRRRGANRWGSVLLGASVLMGFTAYRVLHLRHHRFLGTPEDPDDYHNYTRRKHLVWLMHFARLTIGCVVYIFAIPALALRHGTWTQRRDVSVEYGVLAVLYTLAFLMIPLHVLAVTWLLPLLVVAVMVQVRGFTQHGIADADDPLLASRCIQPNRFVAALVLHENHHLEHHLFPEIPSYHLERLHHLLWPHLPRAVTVPSYGSFVTHFLRQSMTLDETPIGYTEPAKETA